MPQNDANAIQTLIELHLPRIGTDRRSRIILGGHDDWRQIHGGQQLRTDLVRRESGLIGHYYSSRGSFLRRGNLRIAVTEVERSCCWRNRRDVLTVEDEGDQQRHYTTAAEE